MSTSGEFLASMLGGGAAGTMVDVVLYPLDTVKTRLQSEAGFWQSGGFKGVYRGLSSAAAGSAPCGKSRELLALWHETTAKKRREKEARKRDAQSSGGLRFPVSRLSPLPL